MTLQNIRDKIDQLDQQMVDLLNERMRLVAEIGRLKRERGQSVFAPEREELLLQALEKLNQGPLGRIGLRAIYREILSASRANQSKLRIVYLGEENSYDFLAARMRFGSSDCYRAESDWAGAVHSLESNEADVAVVPRNVLCGALAKKSAEKPFSRSLRLCGEINLVREMQADYQLSVNLKPWHGPEQFFVLTCGVEKKALQGKSIFLLCTPASDDLEHKIKQLNAKFQGRIELIPAPLTSRKRFLCEFEEAPEVALAQQAISTQWGPAADFFLLGTYPCPPIYG